MKDTLNIPASHSESAVWLMDVKNEFSGAEEEEKVKIRVKS